MSAIKVKPWGKDQGDFVLIEETDFDPAKHEKIDDQPRRGRPPKSAQSESEE